MLGSVIGSLGSGKTLFLTWLAFISKNKQKIYANYNIDIDNFQKITIQDLESLGKGLILIDEAYLWLDSRLSASERNRYMSKIIFQSRKRGFDIFLSAQLRGSVDLRFRGVEDIIIKADGCDEKENFHYLITDKETVKDFWIKNDVIKELYDLYDTLEYPKGSVESTTRFETDKMNNLIQKYTEKIKENYNEPHSKSKGQIKDIMLKMGESNPHLAEKVYYRLKNEKESN